MKLRNDGPDRMAFGLHFAEGATVEVPNDFPASKLAWLGANFTLVMDEALEPAVVDGPSERGDDEDESDVEEFGPVPRPRRRAVRRG